MHSVQNRLEALTRQRWLRCRIRPHRVIFTDGQMPVHHARTWAMLIRSRYLRGAATAFRYF